MPGRVAETRPGAILGISAGGYMHVEEVRAKIAAAMGLEPSDVRITVDSGFAGVMNVLARFQVKPGAQVETR